LLKGIYPLEVNLNQKLAILAIFWTIRPHFKSHNGDVWCGVQIWDSLSHAKFCKKNCFRGLTPQEHIFTTKFNIPYIDDFGRLKPTFLKPR